MTYSHLPRNVVPGQRGAALIVGLVLLVVVTVLAISGMNTATTELAIARNDQSSENAFQAAEAGLETALSQVTFKTEDVLLPDLEIASSGYSVSTVSRFETTTIAPNGCSYGSCLAYRFVAEATAVSTRSLTDPNDSDASALHTQAFYRIGPDLSSSL